MDMQPLRVHPAAVVAGALHVVATEGSRACVHRFMSSRAVLSVKIFSALLFAHFRFPLQLHVLNELPCRHRYILYMQKISCYAPNAYAAVMRSLLLQPSPDDSMHGNY